jgi:ElaB/YqjD/DUF883 family membrane-anchored ribosome-binding protein
MTLPDAKFRLLGDDRAGREAVTRMRAAVRGLGTDSVRTGNQVEQFSRRLSRGVSQQRRFALGVQNASFQVGDFAVQMASGTNWIRAASQQLPQLLGGMGVLGAVAGAATAIIGALVLGLRGTDEEARSAADAIGDLSGQLSAVQGAVSDLAAIQETLNNLMSAAGDASKGAADAVIQNAKAEYQAKKQLIEAEKILLELRGQEARQTLENLQSQKRAALDAAQARSREVLRNIGPGATYNPAADAEGYAGGGLRYDDIVNTPGFDDAVAEARANTQATQGSPEFRRREAEILKLQAHLKSLGIVSDEAAEAINGVFGTDGTTGSASGSSGGGGGGRSSGGQKKKTPVETAIEKHINLIRDLTTATQEGLGSSLGAWGGYFDGLVGMTGTKNARLLALGKSFAAAQATIDAWQAHNAVLKDPTLPWWARIASAAKVLASGLGAVRAIQGVTAGGGGGSSTASTASGSATPNTSADQSLQLQFIGEPWQQAMMESLARQMIPALNRVQENGGQLRITVPT